MSLPPPIPPPLPTAARPQAATKPPKNNGCLIALVVAGVAFVALVGVLAAIAVPNFLEAHLLDAAQRLEGHVDLAHVDVAIEREEIGRRPGPRTPREGAGDGEDRHAGHQDRPSALRLRHVPLAKPGPTLAAAARPTLTSVKTV